MTSICRLREANGHPDHPCDQERCIFWRVAGHVADAADVDQGDRTGCAIQYFELIGDDGVASWLLSVKQRVEDPLGG